MIQTILTSIATLLAVSYSLYLLVKKWRILSFFILALVMIAVAALELFDLMAFLQPIDLMLWKKCAMVAESLLPFLWIAFSLTYARLNEPRSISLPQKILILLSCLFPIVAAYFPAETFFYSPDFHSEQVLFLSNIAFYFYIGLLLFTLIPLMYLETTLASSSHRDRWRIKFEILGAMSLLAAMLIYCSQGLLYRTINMNLVPLRSLALIMAVSLMAYSLIFRGNGVRIYVSKQMAFKSVIVIAVGTYLVALGLLGEGMKYLGESIDKSMAIAAGLFAGIGLFVVLLSESIKRKLMVFLHRNFYHQKYDYRAQWLQFTDRLASAGSGDDLLKCIVTGFIDVFGMGCGALFLYDPDKQAYSNSAAIGIDRDESLFGCQDPQIKFMEQKKGIVALTENKVKNELVKTDFLMQNQIVFVVPLLLQDTLEGFVLLGRPVYKEEKYTDEDHDLMMTLGKQALSAILNFRLSDELLRAREMEAVGKLSAFMLHDLKNLVTSLALIVDNARKFIDRPEFQSDMLESLDGTVAKMKALTLRLKKMEEKAILQLEPADLLEVSKSAAAMITAGEITVAGEPAVAEIDKEEMQRVLLNLIINSLEATDGKGPVAIKVRTSGMAVIKVADEGCGMSQEYINNNLFKPFRTTKKKGLGIGLYQCRQIVAAHGGRIEVESEVGKGTIFTVLLPPHSVPDAKHNLSIMKKEEVPSSTLVPSS